MQCLPKQCNYVIDFFFFKMGVCCCVQVDPTGSGRVAAGDAALFLKRSGLADLVLGKVSKD